MIENTLASALNIFLISVRKYCIFEN